MRERTQLLQQEKDLAESALARATQAEKSVIEISEQTLQRIGRELHDDLGQQLTGLAFLSQAVNMNMQTAGISSESELVAKMTELINQAVSRVRQLAHGLYPIELKEAGLPAMLKNLAGELSETRQIKCEFQNIGRWRDFGTETTINLYRISQEAISNALRHGKASDITISLTKTPQECMLEITDNGSGISPDYAAGVGVNSMQYRASMIGWTLEVTSVGGSGKSDRPGMRGTRVSVRMAIQ